MKTTLLLASLFLAPSAQAQEEPDIRVAAFFRATPTGKEHRDGIRDACAALRAGERIHLVEVSYVDEREGDDLLELMILGLYDADPTTEVVEKVDLILGPTDSGVFLRGKARQDEWAKSDSPPVPVISSLVVAEEPNEPEDWFLRTNVDVVKRTGAIYDHLNKRWVTSIAVVYSNTEFGRIAEEAFRDNFSPLQESLYRAFAFEPGRMRRQMGDVLDVRAEAVGIFGSREDVVSGYRELFSQNDSIVKYRPILFTAIDIRSLYEDVDDFHYVSVIRPESDEGMPAVEVADNVHGLSYDTTKLVLRVIGQEPWNPEEFRTNFTANVLGGLLDDARGERTGMRFAGWQNDAKVYVYHMEEGAVTHVAATDVGLVDKLRHKVAMIFRRYGLWPAAVLIAMLLTVIASSLNDFRRWYGGSTLEVMRSRHLLGVVLLQGGIASILYVYLCETGTLRYDGLLPAVLVALSPSPILRTTLVRIGGRPIGFSDVYDRALKSLTRGYIVSRYKRVDVNIRFVAYYNSYEGLRRRVDQLFRKLPNTDEVSRLQADFEAKVANTKDKFQQRLACAEILVQLRTWQELKDMGLVRRDVPLNPPDPQSFINRAVNHCLKRHLKDKIQKTIRRELQGYGSVVVQHYKNKLRDAGTDPRDELYAMLQFLALRFGYGQDELIAVGFLPPDPERPDAIHNPKGHVARAVEHCMSTGLAADEIVETELKSSPDSARKKLREDVAAAATQADQLKAVFTYLVTRRAYDEAKLVTQGYLPDDEDLAPLDFEAEAGTGAETTATAERTAEDTAAPAEDEEPQPGPAADDKAINPPKPSGAKTKPKDVSPS